MYICTGCGNLEEELHSYIERHGNGPDAYYEPLMDCNCPWCGDYMAEATLCPMCGEWYHYESSGYQWCDQCLEAHTDEGNILNYINTDINLQKEFYICVQFDCWVSKIEHVPDELLALCRERFEELLKLGKHFPQVKEHTDKLLLELVDSDRSTYYETLSASRRGW